MLFVYLQGVLLGMCKFELKFTMCHLRLDWHIWLAPKWSSKNKCHVRLTKLSYTFGHSHDNQRMKNSHFWHIVTGLRNVCLIWHGKNILSAKGCRKKTGYWTHQIWHTWRSKKKLPKLCQKLIKNIPLEKEFLLHYFFCQMAVGINFFLY